MEDILAEFIVRQETLDITDHGERGEKPHRSLGRVDYEAQDDVAAQLITALKSDEANPLSAILVEEQGLKPGRHHGLILRWRDGLDPSTNPLLLKEQVLSAEENQQIMADSVASYFDEDGIWLLIYSHKYELDKAWAAVARHMKTGGKLRVNAEFQQIPLAA